MEASTLLPRLPSSPLLNLRRLGTLVDSPVVRRLGGVLIPLQGRLFPRLLLRRDRIDSKISVCDYNFTFALYIFELKFVVSLYTLPRIYELGTSCILSIYMSLHM